MPTDSQPAHEAPTDEDEYEELLLSVATRIVTILSDLDDEDDDPEDTFLSAT
jgi:hypothetical protein